MLDVNVLLKMVDIFGYPYYLSNVPGVYTQRLKASGFPC